MAAAVLTQQHVHALQKALEAGDVSSVRAQAADLLNDYSDDEDVREAVGAALVFCGAVEEGLPYVRADQHSFRARLYGVLGRFDEARRELDLAEAQGDPDARNAAAVVESRANAMGQFNKLTTNADTVERGLMMLAHEHLRRDMWAEGLELERLIHDRRDRYTMGGKMLYRLGGDCPRWSGEPVDHLLLINADGNGDLLQFGRYVNEARRLCKRITIACGTEMHSIVLRSLRVDAVVAPHEAGPVLQQADAYMTVWLMLADTLNMRHGEPMRIEPIEGSVPDLGDGLHVGLCWAASVSGKNRSVRFAALAPLQSLPGVHFHSLQVGTAADEPGPWVTRHVLRTYDDTASLIAGLDAVVSVDTSVVHLAGNIGKPTHLLLCPYEDWRWGTRDTTPWYPSMRLYRGNLGKAVKAIAQNLRRPSERETVEQMCEIRKSGA